MVVSLKDGLYKPVFSGLFHQASGIRVRYSVKKTSVFCSPTGARVSSLELCGIVVVTKIQLAVIQNTATNMPVY